MSIHLGLQSDQLKPITPGLSLARHAKQVDEKVPTRSKRAFFGGYKIITNRPPIVCGAFVRVCFSLRILGWDFFSNL